MGVSSNENSSSRSCIGIRVPTSSKHRVLALVSCGKAKLGVPAPARELYTSPLFKKSRLYAAAIALRWFIFSAKHGLLDPRSTIEPYDTTLATAGVQLRRRWARSVTESLRCEVECGDEVVFLAGRRYIELLAPELESMGATVENPLAGLGTGLRLQWLDKALERLK